jgi:hypothetical protein
MLDYYHHDTNGTNIFNAIKNIMNQTSVPSNSSGQNNSTTNNNNTNGSSTSNTSTTNTSNTSTPTNTSTTNTSNTSTPTTPSNTTNQTTPSTNTTVNYTVPFPIYFTYVNSITSWWGDSMLTSLGVPGYAAANSYNYFAYSFWTYGAGPVDVAKAWS